MKSKPSRRQVLATTLAAAAASSVTAATTQPDAVTPADVEAFEKLSARSYTPPEREMMAAGLADLRDTLKHVRAANVSPDVTPALRFDPRPDGFAMPKLDDAIVPSRPEVKFDGNVESLAFATVAELSTLIATRRLTSVQLTRMYLDRLKRIGPKLLCVITLTEDLALHQAERADKELAAGKLRGPLHGIPWGAKDLFATKGIPTTWGVKPYADRVIDADADVVKRLDDAGAVLVAKLSMGELAMGDVWFGGKTRNPWDNATGSSGSSAGPAAATAGGLVAFAIGTETLGSIVSPSITCGLTGLRTTYGAVSRRGAMALAQTMDKVGPMCRCVEDCALVYAAIRDANMPLTWDASLSPKGLRVGIHRPAFDGVKDPARRKLYDAALDALKATVGDFIPVTLPPGAHYTGLTHLTIGAESACNFVDLLQTGRIRELVQQDAGSWPNYFRGGTTIPAADYLRAHQVRSMLIAEMNDVMKNVDLYVTVPYAGGTLAITNLTGHPSLIARCGMAGGKPVSIEFIGGLFREDAILRAGYAVEQAVSPKSPWPDTSNLPDPPQ